ILTIHHWTNWRAGLAEVKRVTRRRIVVLTADVFRDDEPFWLKEYFPGINAWDRAHIQPIDDVLQELWPARVERLPVPADCTDGFCGAYWRRPAAYLRPEVRNGISGFSQIGGRDLLGELREAASAEIGARVRRRSFDRALHLVLGRQPFELAVADEHVRDALIQPHVVVLQVQERELRVVPFEPVLVTVAGQRR